MIDSPSLQLEISPSDHFQLSGPESCRVRQFVQRWMEFHTLDEEPACHVEVVNAPRQHSGLGTGTQLGLSIAAGLTAFLDLPMPSPAELATSVGRGIRSAVGTHGFAEGGLIVEGGKLPHESISRLDCRWDIPAQWRFVMICPRVDVGLFGEIEQQAFATLPAVTAEVTEQLQQEVRQRMIPAIINADFEAFCESVYQYGRTSGMCFASRQGGPYNGPRLAEIVATIRTWGVRGVGQSSWGPTIFAITPNQTEAEKLAEQLMYTFSLEDNDIWISEPNNDGALVSIATPSPGLAAKAI